jgi:hypothetical protein
MLMNIMYDHSLTFWNINPRLNDIEQIKLRRLFASKSVMAWTELLKDAIAARLTIFDSDEKVKIFYREISNHSLDMITVIVKLLINHQVWSAAKDSEIDKIIAGSKSTVKDWLKNKGLTAGYLLGAE